MSLVEGVGDEVIEFLIGIFFVTIGVVAWWSTRTVDRPIIRTVVVFERRAQNQSNNTIEELRSETQSQRDYVEELTPTTPVESSGSQPRNNNKPQPSSGSSNGPSVARSSRSTADELNEIVEAMDSETSVLRRRRLDFFEGRQDPQPSAPETENVEIGATGSGDTSETSNIYKVPSAPPPSDITGNQTENNIHSDNITIKLKYINDDLRLVNGKLREPLGAFKRRHFEGELADDKLVRLIFNGQVLQRDDLTLEGCGLFDNCVVHCLVHQKRTTTTPGGGGGVGGGASASTPLGGGSTTDGTSGSTHGRSRRGRSIPHTHTNREWDLGNLFFAIVSFMLGAAWYFRYEYAQLYTVTATVALVGLTGIFTVLLVGMYFPDPEPAAPPVRS